MFSYSEKMNLPAKVIFFWMIIFPELIFGALCLFFYLSPEWFVGGLENIDLLKLYGINVGVRFVYYLIVFGIFGPRERHRGKK